jgi:hypothetical protein
VAGASVAGDEPSSSSSPHATIVNANRPEAPHASRVLDLIALLQ